MRIRAAQRHQQPRALVNRILALFRACKRRSIVIPQAQRQATAALHPHPSNQDDAMIYLIEIMPAHKLSSRSCSSSLAARNAVIVTVTTVQVYARTCPATIVIGTTTRRNSHRNLNLKVKPEREGEFTAELHRQLALVLAVKTILLLKGK